MKTKRMSFSVRRDTYDAVHAALREGESGSAFVEAVIAVELVLRAREIAEAPPALSVPDAEPDVDPRTVRRYLDGDPIRPVSRRRIEGKPPFPPRKGPRLNQPQVIKRREEKPGPGPQEGRNVPQAARPEPSKPKPRDSHEPF